MKFFLVPFFILFAISCASPSLTRKPSSDLADVKKTVFQNPFFTQLLDPSKKIVCYSTSSYTKGELSCVNYDQENQEGKVFAEVNSDSYFLRIVDEPRRVACYSMDSSSGRDTQKNIQCLKY